MPSTRPAPWPAAVVANPDGTPDVTGLRRTAILLDDGSLYLERYHLVDTEQCQVRLHHWVASDDQRALHDHPWSNATTVLAGHLVEHTPTGTTHLPAGTVVVRRPTDTHRIELVGADAWTLFVTGPIVRRWGFHTPAGWVHWTDWPYAGRYQDAPAPAGKRW